jgi:hypothetical protein
MWKKALIVCFFMFFVGFTPCLLARPRQYEPKHWKNTLLIINFNHPFYNSIPFLEQIYGKEFPNIVFYGEQRTSLKTYGKARTAVSLHAGLCN